MDGRHSKSLFLVWGVAIGVFLIGLVVMAPASLISQHLSDASDHHLSFANPVGHVWQGNADIYVQGTPEQSPIKAGSVAWQLHLNRLFFGQIVGTWTWNGVPAGEVLWHWRKTDIQHINMQMPSSVIATFVPMIATVQLGGELQLQADKITLTQQDIQGTLYVTLHNTTSSISHVNPLGDYQLLLQDEDQSIKLTLNTMKGPLQLEGQGYWTLTKGLDFDATASATPEYAEALADILHILGNETAAQQGQYHVHWGGR